MANNGQKRDSDPRRSRREGPGRVEAEPSRTIDLEIPSAESPPAVSGDVGLLGGSSPTTPQGGQGDGGIHSAVSRPTIENCVFLLNTAADASGGAAYTQHGALNVLFDILLTRQCIDQ